MSRSSARGSTLSLLLIALVVVFGVQLIRVLMSTFVNYLRDSQGMSAVSLAPIALGVFALSFLAGPLRRFLGLRWALVLTVAGVTIMRAVEQLSFIPLLDLILAALGVAFFAMFAALALEVARPAGAAGTYQFGLAFILGLTVDTAIHAGAATLDLSWQEGPLPAFIILALAIIALVLLWRQAGAIDPSIKTSGGWSRALAVTALGPWLFLQLVVFQNVARMAAITGWPLPAAGFVVGVGNVIALIAAAHAPRSRRYAFLPIVVALVFFLSLLFIETEGLPGAFLSVVGQVLGASLMLYILVTLGWLSQQTGRLSITIANGIGQLLFVIFTFAYYITFDLNVGFRAPAVLPAAGLLVAVSALAVSRGLLPQKRVTESLLPAGIAGLLLLSPILLWFTWSTPEPATPTPLNQIVRVMNYNLHNGFNTDGRLDIEALAQTIEASGADIIGLQEVARGWVIYGSLDMMQWLSHRLDLPYIYGPTEGQQWGNAILSRYPIVTEGSGDLPSQTLPLRRGYVVAEIDTGAKNLWVINTHLHHIEADSDIRQSQVPILIYAWSGAARTVMMGDFNATPDAPEMALLVEAGFNDVGGIIGPDPGYTHYSADPHQRIDYIWTTPDLIPNEYAVGQTTASDHLPLSAMITIP